MYEKKFLAKVLYLIGLDIFVKLNETERKTRVFVESENRGWGGDEG